jgi:hypothetical protein
MDRGLVADGQLVVPGGHRPLPLEPVDPALHRMPQLVEHPVKGGRAAAPPASGPPVGGLVVLLRDGGPDAPAAKVGAIGPGAVGLVGQHPVGPGAGPPRAQARHPDATKHRGELGAVAAMAGGDQDRQGALATLDGQVQLAGQSAPGAPERVVLGLVVDSAWFFALPVPPLRAPAACWWARTTVVSTLTCQVISPLASA